MAPDRAPIVPPVAHGAEIIGAVHGTPDELADGGEGFGDILPPPVIARVVAAVRVPGAGGGVEIGAVAVVGVVGEPGVDGRTSEGVGGVGVHGVWGEGGG